MAARAGTPFCGKSEPFSLGPWKFCSTKSHILKSDEAEKLSKELPLPQLPEMTFGNNNLEICHASGFTIEFNAIDALRLVDPHNDLMKVAMAKEWKESRENNEYIAETVKPFDWTFTTNYKGTIKDPQNKTKVIESKNRIDIEKLKAREKILFFEELMLFEDELADNGCAQLTVKIRVMPSCFFLLMRFFLRVDGVISRIYDTRLYHEFGSHYLIREYSEKEKSFTDLRRIPPATLTDSNLLDRHLSLKKRLIEEIQFEQTNSASKSTPQCTSTHFVANTYPVNPASLRGTNSDIIHSSNGKAT